MQQGFKSAGFTIIELEYRAFDALLSSHKELLFLYSAYRDYLSVLIFYTDDLFNRFISF